MDKKIKMKEIDFEDVYADGKHYDSMNNFNWDLPFYTKYAKASKGSVLELACGTGRLTIPIAYEGIDIMGIDISKDMIKQAKEKAKEQKIIVDFKVLDIRNFDLNKKFSLIFLPYNSICHIHDFESIKALFHSVKKHLEPNGKFIIDVFNPSLELLTRKKDEIRKIESYKNPYNESEVLHTESNFYNKAEQVNYIDWFLEIDNKKEKQALNMRMFFPQELDNYLKFAGFEIIDKFGDHFENTFDENSSLQIIVCKVL